MKLVTYNVNGLRARVTSSRSLRSFLDSLEAGIICIQETKVSRQDLTSDVAVAEGYESFFSCTRTVKKGRIGYSGVATFCRTNHDTDVALPLAAEEGFTGLLSSEHNADNAWLGQYNSVLVVKEFSKQELLELDSEGRCVVTDHGHFVLFNIYGPNAGGDDLERQQFKLKFFRALQHRFEELLGAGRRVIVVGDLNISPFAIDSCDPGPNFESNQSRKWLRSLLQSGNGPFLDVFRVFHPDRREAYTCWSQACGAEEFNYGTRIDLILAAGPCCLDNCENKQETEKIRVCNFALCGVVSCDILHAFKRKKSDELPRWANGRSLKLDGSDHAPVYVRLKPLPSLPPHDVPQSAARFMPGFRGRQQSIVSVFQKVGKRPSSQTTTTTEQETQKCLLDKQQDGTSKSQKLSQTSLRAFWVQKMKDSAVETSSRMEFSEQVSEETKTIEAGKLSATATEDWDRLKRLMTKVPLCRGHGEPCVVRNVKKPGANNGRGFYVCARAKGPASNPDARCDHFEWASGKVKPRKN